VKRNGRKEMQLPDGAAHARKPDNTLIKALARAFRWKRMLDSGEFMSAAELAEHEGIAPSYVTRILQLTFLAPDCVDAIVEGTLSKKLSLAEAIEISSMEWNRQVR
jgi:hypothetical protein